MHIRRFPADVHNGDGLLFWLVYLTSLSRMYIPDGLKLLGIEIDPIKWKNTIQEKATVSFL